MKHDIRSQCLSVDFFLLWYDDGIGSPYWSHRYDFAIVLHHWRPV